MRSLVGSSLGTMYDVVGNEVGLYERSALNLDGTQFVFDTMLNEPLLADFVCTFGGDDRRAFKPQRRQM